MKICAIICEFNPFHNGHAYLIEQAKKLSGCDAVLCVMSGSFTQRGDVSILDEFTRAKHAIEGGADCVIKLPVCFSVAPAQIFAEGAIKLILSIPSVTTLAFGCESQVDFYEVANKLSNEDDSFKSIIKEHLDSGESYIKSYFSAYKAFSGDEFLATPNNILAVEYAKAIIKGNKKLNLLPIKRVGGSYNDDNLYGGFSSASAIRNNLHSPTIKNEVPKYVYDNLINVKAYEEKLNTILKYALITESKENLQRTYGCNEGLENKLKSLCNLPIEEILNQTCNKRYSLSRIKRILLANALKLYKDDTESFLERPLYIKPLAINKLLKDEILAELAKSENPVVIMGKDVEKLNNTAKKCFEIDLNANAVRDEIFVEDNYNFTVKLV